MDEWGKLPIKILRDRNSGFEPTVIPKGQIQFDRLNDKIILLYARGMTIREIQGYRDTGLQECRNIWKKMMGLMSLVV